MLELDKDNRNHEGIFSAKIVHPVPATAHKTAETRFSPSSTKMQQARTHFIEQFIFKNDFAKQPSTSSI